MKTYLCKRKKGDAVCLVRGDGDERELLPDESLKIRAHSPNGFEFGYSGSGPAQLALAILLDYCRVSKQPDDLAVKHYQAFKNFFVANVKDGSDFIHDYEIQKFLDAVETISK